MSSAYQLHARYEVYQILRATRSVYRLPIVRFIESLPDNPFQTSDYEETDAQGRTISVKIVGKFAVYYWLDHAVREIRVVDLMDADKK